MVNETLLKEHLQYPEDDPRHLPFKTLAAIDKDRLYNMDEVANTGVTKQPKALFAKGPLVS